MMQQMEMLEPDLDHANGGGGAPGGADGPYDLDDEEGKEVRNICGENYIHVDRFFLVAMAASLPGDWDRYTISGPVHACKVPRETA